MARSTDSRFPKDQEPAHLEVFSILISMSKPGRVPLQGQAPGMPERSPQESGGGKHGNPTARHTPLWKLAELVLLHGVGSQMPPYREDWLGGYLASRGTTTELPRSAVWSRALRLVPGGPASSWARHPSSLSFLSRGGIFIGICLFAISVAVGRCQLFTLLFTLYV